MNVLILTPDAVGSTLLQRLVTVYMQLQNFSKPVINLHELTNGIERYYSDVFNQEVLGKPRDRSYHQSLPEIQTLLSSVDHYVTSRLAKYHIDRRNDLIDHQIPFFRYLNDNFFIIATRRKNIFEHAVSWCINSFTKKLNVYDPGEKIASFLNFYKDPIVINTIVLTNYLNAYKNYTEWSTQYFDVGSFFIYEDNLPNIENFILSLPIFNGQTRIGWKETFGISFRDWNVFHHLSSDLESIAVNQPSALYALENQHSSSDLSNAIYPNTQLISEYNQVKDDHWPDVQTWEDFEGLPQHIREECAVQHQLSSLTNKSLVDKFLCTLDPTSQQFLLNHKTSYHNASSAIAKMTELGILIGGLPIKKQTLAGKKAMVKNWQQCVDVYNRWIDQNPEMGTHLDHDSETALIENENLLWQPASNNRQQLGCN